MAKVRIFRACLLTLGALPLLPYPAAAFFGLIGMGTGFSLFNLFISMILIYPLVYVLSFFMTNVEKKKKNSNGRSLGFASLPLVYLFLLGIVFFVALANEQAG